MRSETNPAEALFVIWTVEAAESRLADLNGDLLVNREVSRLRQRTCLE